MKTIIELTQEFKNKFSEKKVIAPVESTSTASQAYAVGKKFFYNNILYKCTTAIAKNGSIVPGTNCTTADSVETQIDSTDTEVNNVKQALSNEVETRATLGAHNLLPLTVGTQTINGVTFTVNSDKSVTVNGTASANTDFPLTDIIPNTFEGMVLNGSPSYSSSNLSILVSYFQGTTWKGEQFSYNNANSTVIGPAQYSAYTHVRFAIYVKNGEVISNKTFYPMIRLATDSDTTYRPYVPTNSQLLSYKDNGVLGAKNLLNDSFIRTSGTDSGTGMTVTNYGDGTFSISGTPSANAWVKIVLSTNAMPNNLKAGTYKLSIKGAEGVNIGGYTSSWSVLAQEASSDTAIFTVDDTIKEFYINVHVTKDVTYSASTKMYPMILLPTDTDPTYQPYAMTNKELTDVAVQEIGNYALKIRRNSLYVTADGTKDYQTLLNELKLAFDSYLTSNSDVYAQPVGIKIDTARYTVDDICLTDGEWHDTTSSTMSAFVISISSTHVILLKIRLHTTKANCNMYKSYDGTLSDESSTVPASGIKLYLYFDVYKKIS